MLNFRTFLLDRLSFIAVYFVNTGLGLLVINLGVLQRGTKLDLSNNLYIALLSLFFMALFLGIGYGRRRQFYRQIREAVGPAGQSRRLEDALRIQSAANREEAALQQLLHELYRANAEELLRLRQQSRRQHEFIQMWVHQMKTPVSVIDLLVQQAERETLPEEARDRYISLGEENERIAQGLAMILHSSRLEKFEMDVQVRRIGLTGLLRRMINDYKKTWIRHSLFPKLVAPEAEVYVNSDLKWLEFMLQQFITNAVKYSFPARADNPEAGEKSARRRAAKELRFSVRKEGDGSVSLSIQDEGIGIPEQDLPRIFDPFFTGDNGRLTKESTGMGLYIAKQVCLKLGHGLQAESVQGQGTVLTLTFPFGGGIHSLHEDA